MKTAVLDHAGLTVVEVLIALGVVMIGLVALIAAMPFATSVIGDSNRKTTAAFLAQQRMEQIKMAQWTIAPPVDTLGGGGSNGTAAVAVAGFANRWPDEAYNTIEVPAGAGTARYPAFRRLVRISDCSVVICSGIPIATASINGLRQVTVTVFFKPLTGPGTASADEERVQLATLIAQRP